jgi:hypothetical protein
MAKVVTEIERKQLFLGCVNLRCAALEFKISSTSILRSFSAASKMLLALYFDHGLKR